MKPHTICFGLLVVIFLTIFNNTITNMAGIYIASDLGGSPKISVYPMVFYGLGNLLTLPLAAPFGERYGQKNMLIVCLLLFTLCSYICAYATTFFLFNICRFLLGLSSGPFYVLCRAFINRIAPKETLPTYSFILILLFSIVPVLGACFGAWIAYDYQWQWVFHVCEPISLFLAFYFWRTLRHTEKTHKLTFDPIGYLFFVLGTSSLVTGLTMAEELDWYRSNIFLSLILIGTPAFLFFLIRDWNHQTPLFHFPLLKNLRLSYALFNLAILFSTYFGMIFLIALWLNIYANYTPLWIAALIGTMGIAGLLAYPIGHFLLTKFDLRITLALAIISFMSSCYYSTFFDVDVDFFHLMVARFLAGLGLILFIYPLFLMALSSYSPEYSNATFTLFQGVRLLSSSLGAALYVIVWHRRQIFFHERLGEGLTPTSPLTAAYFERANEQFLLPYEQAKEQLNNILTKDATSLALNDSFGLMGYILLALFALLLFSFFSPLSPEKACAKQQ